MSDIINRQDAIKALGDAHFQNYGNAIMVIQELPSVEPKERTAKVSNQIFNNVNPYTVGAWIGTCECGELVSYSSKYCHMCGAKLDWGVHGEVNDERLPDYWIAS